MRVVSATSRNRQWNTYQPSWSGEASATLVDPYRDT